MVVVVVSGWGGGRPNLVYSPGPGLWSLVLGPFGPYLGPDLGPELDKIKISVGISINTSSKSNLYMYIEESFKQTNKKSMNFFTVRGGEHQFHTFQRYV